MKKNIIATLLVLALASITIFAADATGQFDVVTSVGGIHEIKLVTVGTTVPTNKGGFDGLSADNSDFTVDDNNYNTIQTVRQLISMSNNRNGYYMTLSATAMEADLGTEFAYINYDVIAGGASVTTNDGTTVTSATNIYDSGTLSGITFYSTNVTVEVDAEEYENAVTGSYSGTITFNLFAN